MKREAVEVQRVLARNFRCARLGLGLSQEMLARRSGLPQPTICQVETASINVTLRTLAKLSEAVGWSVRKLLTKED